MLPRCNGTSDFEFKYTNNTFGPHNPHITNINVSANQIELTTHQYLNVSG